jgi:hypothetical protein
MSPKANLMTVSDPAAGRQYDKEITSFVEVLDIIFEELEPSFVA